MNNRNKSVSQEKRVNALLMVVRQALIMILGGLEDFLGMERSIVPRRKRYDPPTSKRKTGGNFPPHGP